MCITDKLFTHSLKGLSKYAKYHALTQYFPVWSNIYLSDCIPSSPLLMLEDVVHTPEE